MENSARMRRIRQDLGAVMREIRQSTPYEILPTDQAKASEVWEGCFDGQPCERLIIYFRGSGCTWPLGTNRHGVGMLGAGCLDCEHCIAGTTMGKPISAESYVRQFENECRKYDMTRFPILCVYNEGSFFNPDELPPEARRSILRQIAKIQSIKSVILESLPQYIDDNVLKETMDILGDRRVEIGIGLESANPLVRDLCINKPFTLEQFVEAVEVINRFCTPLAYVLLKPSLLTEAEALRDTIAAIRYAFSVGVKVVSIEPISIGTHALSGVLSRIGLYRSAWLWSVLEAAKVSVDLGETRIGGYQFAPAYGNHARNCEICSMLIKESIRKFNATGDFSVFRDIDCCCKSEWGVELERSYPPLLDRIEATIGRLNELYQLPLAS
jgi:archaeosine synthase beta-subunit